VRTAAPATRMPASPEVCPRLHPITCFTCPPRPAG
jgi:hypothetical protein